MKIKKMIKEYEKKRGRMIETKESEDENYRRRYILITKEIN